MHPMIGSTECSRGRSESSLIPEIKVSIDRIRAKSALVCVVANTTASRLFTSCNGYMHETMEHLVDEMVDERRRS